MMQTLKNSKPFLGGAIYPLGFEKHCGHITNAFPAGSHIFTSLHIPEDQSSDYIYSVQRMCDWLYRKGYQVIADVSPRTLSYLQCNDWIELFKRYRLKRLRIDYGFSLEEVVALARRLPIAINASTISPDALLPLLDGKENLIVMHNYYPKPETGLSVENFSKRNMQFHQMGLEVCSFIPGDLQKRRPLYAGLPTLERDRLLPPFVAFALSAQETDGVFVGDIGISSKQLDWIHCYQQKDIVTMPVQTFTSSIECFHKTYTVRVDSPKTSWRLAESREYASIGRSILPENTKTRVRGCITMDNVLYQRYAGEMQIITNELPANPRVNVIGKIPKEYHFLFNMPMIGKRLRFIVS